MIHSIIIFISALSKITGAGFASYIFLFLVVKLVLRFGKLLFIDCQFDATSSVYAWVWHMMKNNKLQRKLAIDIKDQEVAIAGTISGNLVNSFMCIAN